MGIASEGEQLVPVRWAEGPFAGCIACTTATGCRKSVADGITVWRAQNGNIDRVIVITDEQDCSGHGDSPLSAPIIGKMNYMINVASYRNGVGYGNWTHIDGFSEAVIRYIREYEGI